MPITNNVKDLTELSDECIVLGWGEINMKAVNTGKLLLYYLN